MSMNFRHIAAVVVCSRVTPWRVAQVQAPSPTKAEIEKIVRDYILQHPEVLIDSIRQMQERERASKAQKSKDAVTTRQADLTADPTSPASRPASEKTVNIVEFFDYHCGFCKRVMPTLSKVLAGNPNVRMVYKEFPILGPESTLGAKAALAVAKQGGYLKFHDSLMNLNGAHHSGGHREARARPGSGCREAEGRHEVAGSCRDSCEERRTRRRRSTSLRRRPSSLAKS